MSKIAVIGGGPMGLTVAYELLKRGEADGLPPRVEVFEKDDRHRRAGVYKFSRA